MRQVITNFRFNQFIGCQAGGEGIGVGEGVGVGEGPGPPFQPRSINRANVRSCGTDTLCVRLLLILGSINSLGARPGAKVSAWARASGLAKVPGRRSNRDQTT